MRLGRSDNPEAWNKPEGARWWIARAPVGVSSSGDVPTIEPDRWREIGWTVEGPYVPEAQLVGAIHRGDWFRQAWANATGISVEEAERSFETLGDITAKRGQ
jgi:hypothetical protein